MPLDLITVAVPVPLYRTFDYRLEPGLSPPVGARVRVPFGRRTQVGVVVTPARREQGPADEFKPLGAVLDTEPLLPAELLQLLRWTADYYQYPLGETLALALPGGLRQGKPPRACRDEVWVLTAAGRAALGTLPGRLAAQRRVLEGLASGVQPPRSAALRRVLEQGWVQALGVAEAPFAAAAGPEPTAEQQAALAALRAGEGFRASLLQGVTGSGKTELYLQLAADCLRRGQQALILVPEIGLTPQIVQRFRDRFGPAVACFHSGLGDAAREQAWLQARAGEARVVIGTRSAVFVPFARLGLIVVDEEHDVSYKQQEGLRYSARDVALYRASRNGIPVVLGSATPALETLHNARSGRYAHVRLRRRVSESAPPRVQVLDVRGLPLQHGLSTPLLQAVGRHLDAGGQALLFLNRRGYAPVLLCHDCGWSAPCARCDAHLTLHRGRSRLICHHCGAQGPVPACCPSCDSRALHPVGQGTERIEEALRRHFPGERVERLDSDRARRGRELDRLLDDVHAGRVRLLVGTQMLAKGHDFSGLSLVGIVSADQALYGTDFRAIERMGALITQVAGRAGRAQTPGEVWLQTHEPEHPLLQTLLHHGYEALCDALLQERRDTGLPPYAHLALLRAEAREPERALAFLRAARAAFVPTEGVTVYEPIPSGMERRAGYVRAQLLLACPSRARLHAPLASWVRGLDALPGARRVRWSLDVDPYDLF